MQCVIKQSCINLNSKTLSYKVSAGKIKKKLINIVYIIFLKTSKICFYVSLLNLTSSDKDEISLCYIEKEASLPCSFIFFNILAVRDYTMSFSTPFLPAALNVAKELKKAVYIVNLIPSTLKPLTL
jgi:hypothetical protein